MFAAVDFNALLEVVWTSLIAGVAMTAAFSLVIYGSGQSAEARRDGRGGAATAYGVLAAVAMLAVAGGVVLAISLILNKG